MEYLIVATCLINLVLIGLFFVKNGGKKSQLTQELRDFFREEFRDNRTELNQSLSTNREENNKSIDRLTKQL